MNGRQTTRPIGVHAPVDLDPDDHAARTAVRDTLRSIRVSLRIRQYALEHELGWGPGRLHCRETSPVANLSLSQVIVWANALDHAFALIPVGIPGYRDTTAARVLEAIGGDAYKAAAVIDRMIAARRTETTLVAVADRLGVHYAAVGRQERGDNDNALVSSWQRYARGLSGRLDLVLSPFESGEVTV